MADLIKKIRTDKGDLQIDYNALANLPTINNNLLINGDFKINQRNSKNYIQTNTWKYSVDRWRYIGIMNVAVNDSGTVTISKTNNSSETYFSQVLEDIHGAGSFVFSFRVQSISGTMTAYIDGGNGGTLTVTSAGVYEITSSQGARSVVFRLDGSNASVELMWAKLEHGTKATTFISRLRAEELMLCRRYYRMYSHGYFIGLAITTTESIVFQENQGPMRTGDPTLRILNTTTFNPLVQNVDTYVNLTTGYVVAAEHAQIVSFDIGTAVPGQMGRIYGEFEIDAEIY